MICTALKWFLQVLTGKNLFSRISPKYFRSGSLVRIFHESKSSGRNLEFTVGNTVENVMVMKGKHLHKSLNTDIAMFSTTFSTVNPRFLLEDLLSSKKNVYMKNAQE